jgi:hypothetical protein
MYHVIVPGLLASQHMECRISTLRAGAIIWERAAIEKWAKRNGRPLADS